MEVGPALLQVALALVATLALVFAAAWMLKRIGGAGLRATGAIRVLATTALGTRERLLLVEIHGQQLLLGVTQHQVNKLHAFSADAPRIVPDEDFKATLKSWMSRS
jgi:flagellar protein FliO/FliZ